MGRYHDRFLRLVAIDTVLREYRYPVTKKKLIDCCEDAISYRMSISTCEKDLQYMREVFDAPIVYSKMNGGYSYSDKTFNWLENYCETMAQKLSQIRKEDDKRIRERDSAAVRLRERNAITSHGGRIIQTHWGEESDHEQKDSRAAS